MYQTPPVILQWEVEPGNEAIQPVELTVGCTSLASITVPTPTVRAIFGTWFTSPPKNWALAWIVSTARDLILVREAREEPGSLKAMWPSGPIPGWQRECVHTCTGVYTYSSSSFMWATMDIMYVFSFEHLNVLYVHSLVVSVIGEFGQLNYIHVSKLHASTSSAQIHVLCQHAHTHTAMASK